MPSEPESPSLGSDDSEGDHHRDNSASGATAAETVVPEKIALHASLPNVRINDESVRGIEAQRRFFLYNYNSSSWFYPLYFILLLLLLRFLLVLLAFLFHHYLLFLLSRVHGTL